MLLARLQGEAVGGLAVGVQRDSDEPSRQLPLETRSDGEVARVRTAEAERNAEALRGAHRDVGAGVAGRGEQGESEQIGRDGDEGASLVGRVDDRRQVTYLRRTRPGYCTSTPKISPSGSGWSTGHGRRR